MFAEQFNIIEEDTEHCQYVHLKIDEQEFNKYLIKSIFDDNDLYKYVTNLSAEEMKDIGIIYPVKQLIHLIKNLKKEYISKCVPKNIKKEICKKMRINYRGKIINVKEKDWEIKFDAYLEDDINGYDVIAEIILSKIIEEKFGANVFITKLAQTTNTNMRVFGIDTVHYNSHNNTMYFGESKLTNDIELGINQHTAELSYLD